MAPDSIPTGFDLLTASMADCLRVKPFKTQNDKSFLNAMIGNTQSVSRYG